jgi:hypothetical protein
VHESSEIVTVFDVLQSKEVLGDRIGLDGAQAMVTIVKVNPDWQIRPGGVPARARTVLAADAGA